MVKYINFEQQEGNGWRRPATTLGKSGLNLQGSLSSAGRHGGQRTAKVIHRSVGEMETVPLTLVQSVTNSPRPLLCFSFQPTQETRTQETGLPHHREQQADKKRDLWRKETHLTRVPRLLSEPSPDTRLHGLFSAALLCFLVWLQWAGFFKQAPDHRSPDVTHKDRYDSYSDDELGFFSPYKV